MSDPTPQTPPGSVRNTLIGSPSGATVQAHTVHGGVGNTTTIHQGPAVPVALDAVPGPPARFIGRAQDLDQITARLDPAPTPRSVVVSVLAGMGGVGKTALALKAAQVAWESGWFCAHLFVDLRGYAPGAEPLSAEAALDVLLRQMGVDPQDIPAGVQERASFYRSALASLTSADEQGRSVLVVADNAKSVSQVRPLLPGPGGHRLMATSREGLHSLAGAHHLDLDVLAPEAAVALLASDLSGHTPGDPRVDDEAELGRLAALCGRLPLALEIAAAYLKRSPRLAPGRLANRLENAASRVDKLKDPDRDAGQTRVLRAVFDTSLAHLNESEARVFLLVAAAPGPTLSTDSAAALTGLLTDEVEEVLEELTAAHLLTHPTPGRWGTHDLLADYARHHPHPPEDRDQALGRLLDHYIATTDAADTHLQALPEQMIPDLFPNRNTALRWLDAEHATLVTAALAAPAFGHTEAAIALPLGLAYYLDRRRYFEDMERLSRRAQKSACTTGDAHREASAWTNLGAALAAVRRFEEAIEAHTRAHDLYQQVDDAHGEARAWNNLGVALAAVRRFEEAIEAHTRDLRYCQRVSDVLGQASAWNNLGTVLAEMGWSNKAIKAHTRSRDLYQQAGDAHREAGAWNNLGVALRQKSRFEEAIEAHTRAREIFHQADDAHREAQACGGLGMALFGDGQQAEAVETVRRAADLFEITGDAHGADVSRKLLTFFEQEHVSDGPTWPDSLRQRGKQSTGNLANPRS